jgi:hypothetical protein
MKLVPQVRKSFVSIQLVSPTSGELRTASTKSEGEELKELLIKFPFN